MQDQYIKAKAVGGSPKENKGSPKDSRITGVYQMMTMVHHNR
jgi:hypothetical protein